MEGNGYTPIQKRILDMLADGLSHRRDQVREVLEDSQSTNSTLRYHIFALRKKLPKSQAIICEVNGRAISYRLVRLLASAYKD